MNDEIWSRAEIESPCVKICVLDRENGLCLGCFRTGDEIAAWSRMPPEARRSVMDALPARKAVSGKRARRGGRAGRLKRDAG